MAPPALPSPLPLPVAVAQIIRTPEGRFLFEIRGDGGGIVATSEPGGFATMGEAVKAMNRLVALIEGDTGAEKSGAAPISR